MKNFFKNWSVIRRITFWLGILALLLSINRDLIQGALGALLIVLAIANIGTTGRKLPRIFKKK